ncbi:hypothetical protein CI238_07727 [Colletotrichum incanum]|uniref:Uncharacterized protein n=1 Tax=Colletotrichum incanum TaxID=1573173 RepID=A0A162NFF0_COLIC|nr:hypothetical protein CI238_07727 [Colletotrichum incanum]
MLSCGAPRRWRSCKPDPTSKEKGATLASFKSQLEDNLKTRETVMVHFKNRIRNLIQDHQKICKELQRRQLDIITHAYASNPNAHRVLGDFLQYEMSDGIQFMLQTEDLVIGFMPKHERGASTEAIGGSKRGTPLDNLVLVPVSNDNGNHETQDTVPDGGKIENARAYATNRQEADTQPKDLLCAE